MRDDKYVVFKKADYDSLMEESPEANWDEFILQDAVVIRRQDVFAPPALDAYGNAILCVVEALKDNWEMDERLKELQDIADYFHAQANLAWQVDRRLPD